MLQSSRSVGLAAVLLLATSLSVLRAHLVARLLGRITAALAVCALCYGRSMIPLGMAAMFTAAMIALAWFEPRREQDLSPARVVG